MGRPNYKLPNSFEEIINKYINHEINNKEAQIALSMSSGTFFKYLKQYKKRQPI